MEYNNKYGKVSINIGVIQTIVSNVLKESYGVSGLVNVSAKEGILEFLGWDNSSKGVNIDIDKNELEIHLHIVIQYGIKISTVCENIISNIKYNVENMTGLKVNTVNINIHGIKVLND